MELGFIGLALGLLPSNSRKGNRSWPCAVRSRPRQRPPPPAGRGLWPRPRIEALHLEPAPAPLPGQPLAAHSRGAAERATAGCDRLRSPPLQKAQLRHACPFPAKCRRCASRRAQASPGYSGAGKALRLNDSGSTPPRSSSGRAQPLQEQRGSRPAASHLHPARRLSAHFETAAGRISAVTPRRPFGPARGAIPVSGAP